MKKELTVSIRSGSMELRTCGNSSKLEIVWWEGDHCFTIAYLSENRGENADIKTVGERPFLYGNCDTFWSLCKLMLATHKAFAVEGIIP